MIEFCDWTIWYGIRQVLIQKSFMFLQIVLTFTFFYFTSHFWKKPLTFFWRLPWGYVWEKKSLQSSSGIVLKNSGIISLLSEIYCWNHKQIQNHNLAGNAKKSLEKYLLNSWRCSKWKSWDVQMLHVDRCWGKWIADVDICKPWEFDGRDIVKNLRGLGTFLKKKKNLKEFLVELLMESLR